MCMHEYELRFAFLVVVSTEIRLGPAADRAQLGVHTSQKSLWSPFEDCYFGMHALLMMPIKMGIGTMG